MNLHPAVRAYLDALDPTPRTGLDIVTRREWISRELDDAFDRFGLPGPQVHAIRDHTVPVADGLIRIRTYHPESDGARPAHVLLHGGGWSTCSIDDKVCDATARHRAVAAGCVVALVDYRLAPEHPCPTPVHDTIAAVRWVRQHAAELDINPDIVTLGGASAGANLAAAAVVGADDLNLAALVLEVPALDLTDTGVAAMSSRLDAPEGVLRRDQDEVTLVRTFYLGDPADGSSPLASPLLADDLHRFPETFLLTGGLDPLRVDGERFAARLATAGVTVHLSCYPGMLHGSTILTATFPTARRWHDHTLAILQGIHRRAEAATAAA